MTSTSRRRSLMGLVAVLSVALSSWFVAGTAAHAVTPVTPTPTSVAFGSSHLGVTVSKPVSLKVAAGFQVVQVASYGGDPFGVTDLAASCTSPGPVTCTFRATFRPVVTGAVSGSIRIIACPPSGTDCSTSSIPLTGTGVTTGTTSVTAISFGQVKVGASSSKTLTVKHDAGWFVRDVTFPHQPGTSEAVFAVVGTPTEPCGRSLTSTSCTVSPLFRPRLVGAQNEVLDVRLCSVAEPDFCTTLPSVKLSGTGLAPATLYPTSIAFGNVPVFTSASKPIKVTLDPGWHFEGSDTHASPGSTGGEVPFRPFPDAMTCYAVSTNACTFDQEFSPTTAGSFTAETSVLVCNAASLCVDLPRIPVTGTGAPYATKTTLRSSTTTVPLAQTFTLAATVTPAPTSYLPAGIPRGTVTFFDGKTVLCQDVPIDSGGSATCTATAAGATGAHALTAAFSGNAAGKPSTSGIVYVRVTAAAP